MRNNGSNSGESDFPTLLKGFQKKKKKNRGIRNPVFLRCENSFFVNPNTRKKIKKICFGPCEKFKWLILLLL